MKKITDQSTLRKLAEAILSEQEEVDTPSSVGAAVTGASALAAAALAVTGILFRKSIASFVRERSEDGIEEVLRRMHLERRSSHVLGALGFLAGGIVVGAAAGIALAPQVREMTKNIDRTIPTKANAANDVSTSPSAVGGRAS